MKTETITADPITTPATSPAVEIPVAPPKPMKLSEAMRLGSIDTVQVHGKWSDTNAEGGAAMCAIQTAWYALTGDSDNGANSPLYNLLETRRVSHPVSGGDVSLAGAIMDLNDGHKWTRPQIATWLEEIGL